MTTDLSTSPHPGFAYQGRSMRGTFRPGDLVYTAPVARICPGDVVVYPSAAAEGRLIIHRVRGYTVDGALITQGDNNPHPDAAPVYLDDVLGCAHTLERRGQQRRVWGGVAGRAWASWLRLRQRLFRLGSRPYHWLRASGVVRRVWRPVVMQVSLTTEHGPMIKYICGAHTVAVWRPETETFWCRKPYDLVLDAPGAGFSNIPNHIDLHREVLDDRI